MAFFDQTQQQDHTLSADATAFSPNLTNTATTANSSKGSSILDADFNQAIGQSFDGTGANSASSTSATGAAIDEHDHAPDVSGNGANHISLDGLTPAVTLAQSQIRRTSAINLAAKARFSKGDLIDTGAGANDVAIGAKGNDVFFGDQGGKNTFTTGTGKDSILLGKETTNRVFDFDPTKDKLVLANGLTMDDVVIVQGTNPGKGGLNQPLDSVNNALVVDKDGGHILAALTFVKATSLTADNFRTISDAELGKLKQENIQGFNLMKGSGRISSDQNSNQIIGSSGDDFVRLGGDQVKFNTARATGGQEEFPFANDSRGTTEVNLELKGDRLTINGKYDNFDGAPLFSQGETTIDPKATILNGSDPVSLINGFLKVPQDVEGNKITGTHLHFSPSLDDRGNFADATVIRYIQNNVVTAKSGTIQGSFNLNPEEQAALIAGNLYMNVHTNVDLDKDGKAGFPTGENRVNFNKNVVQFV
jgi:hypothetical protein